MKRLFSGSINKEIEEEKISRENSVSSVIEDKKENDSSNNDEEEDKNEEKENESSSSSMNTNKSNDNDEENKDKLNHSSQEKIFGDILISKSFFVSMFCFINLN